MLKKIFTLLIMLFMYPAHSTLGYNRMTEDPIVFGEGDPDIYYNNGWPVVVEGDASPIIHNGSHNTADEYNTLIFAGKYNPEQNAKGLDTSLVPYWDTKPQWEGQELSSMKMGRHEDYFFYFPVETGRLQGHDQLLKIMAVSEVDNFIGFKVKVLPFKMPLSQADQDALCFDIRRAISKDTLRSLQDYFTLITTNKAVDRAPIPFTPMPFSIAPDNRVGLKYAAQNGSDDWFVEQELGDSPLLIAETAFKQEYGYSPEESLDRVPAPFIPTTFSLAPDNKGGWKYVAQNDIKDWFGQEFGDSPFRAEAAHIQSHWMGSIDEYISQTGWKSHFDPCAHEQGRVERPGKVRRRPRPLRTHGRHP